MDGMTRTEAQLLRLRLIEERRTTTELAGRLARHRREYAKNDADVSHDLQVICDFTADISNLINDMIRNIESWMKQ